MKAAAVAIGSAHGTPIRCRTRPMPTTKSPTPCENRGGRGSSSSAYGARRGRTRRRNSTPQGAVPGDTTLHRNRRAMTTVTRKPGSRARWASDAEVIARAGDEGRVRQRLVGEPAGRLRRRDPDQRQERRHQQEDGRDRGGEARAARIDACGSGHGCSSLRASDGGDGFGEGVTMRDAVETRPDGAGAVDHEGRGGLQHLVPGRQVRSMGQIDLDVAQTVVVCGVCVQHPPYLRAARAHLRAELHERRAGAELGRSGIRPVEAERAGDRACARLGGAGSLR